MNKKEKQTSIELFNKFKSKANPDSINQVSKKIGDMKKGALVKIWDKICELWAMVKDKEVPWHTKAIALGALIYVITPIDAIPDLIPALGLSDDVAVVLSAVASLGIALTKYSNKSVLLDKVIKPYQESRNKESILEQIKAMVSVLSLAAVCDNEITSDEEHRALQLIDYFVFSNEGYCPESFLKQNKLKKKEVKKMIQHYFDNPLSLNQIAEIVDKMESEESIYYYAYAIAQTDDSINSQERVFLDQLAEVLDIQELNKKQIERLFNEEWMDGFQPSLE